MRQLQLIRRSLTLDVLHTLVHVFVTSRVDYCNAVLYGAPAYGIQCLQAVLNAAGCLISRSHPLSEHISPILCDTVQWLPVASALATHCSVH